jgi:hypothetical protein
MTTAKWQAFLDLMISCKYISFSQNFKRFLRNFKRFLRKKAKELLWKGAKAPTLTNVSFKY